MIVFYLCRLHRVWHTLQAVQVMTKICAESERSLDYYGLFKQIMKRAPVPMSPLESLASSAVRTAHKVRSPPSPCEAMRCSTTMLLCLYKANCAVVCMQYLLLVYICCNRDTVCYQSAA